MNGSCSCWYDEASCVASPTPPVAVPSMTPVQEATEQQDSRLALAGLGVTMSSGDHLLAAVMKPPVWLPLHLGRLFLL